MMNVKGGDRSPPLDQAAGLPCGRPAAAVATNFHRASLVDARRLQLLPSPWASLVDASSLLSFKSRRASLEDAPPSPPNIISIGLPCGGHRRRRQPPSRPPLWRPSSPPTTKPTSLVEAVVAANHKAPASLVDVRRRQIMLTPTFIHRQSPLWMSVVPDSPLQSSDIKLPDPTTAAVVQALFQQCHSPRAAL